MGKMTFLGLIFYTLIPFGQMWTRIFDYNGSIDMWWFFIPFFMIPPLQFIPVLLLYLGYIKEGKGGKVYDRYVWIPILTKLVMQMGGKMIIPGQYFFWVSEAIVLTSIIITKYLHTTDSCKVANKQLSTSATKFQTTFIDAVFENGIAGIFNVLIGFVPILGWILMAISMVESLNNIMVFVFWMFGYMFIYTIQNMFEQSDMNSFCNPSGISPFNIIKFIIGLILSGAAYFNENFDPLSMVTSKIPFMSESSDD
jgi:hypothetical protein